MPPFIISDSDQTDYYRRGPLFNIFVVKKEGKSQSERCGSVTRIRRMNDKIREDLVHKSYVKKMLGANPTWHASKNVMYGSRE